MIKKLIFPLVLSFLLFSCTISNEKYSFHKAEELTPLINWHNYGAEPFNKAIKENKPVFILLTAPSWCYWCQVYESEDYLFNSEIVKIINENFIPVYIDADKRQDLTRQYIEGGWPSTVILTPSRIRITGFSGVRPLPIMKSLLKDSIDTVNTQGFANMVIHNYVKTKPTIPTEEILKTTISNYERYLTQIYDPKYGGFGSGQKFPQPRSLDYALDLYDEGQYKILLTMVQNTLNNQYTRVDELNTNYNLFDPVEGGFHRYGTKSDWTPPHYEKMLYDNVKLLKTYFHLKLIIPENPIVNEVVEKTLAFIEREYWDSDSGGFYANSDVYGEDAYYGKFPRPLPKPRVEKTKYTDWNSEAILTYLYLWEKSNNITYKKMAEKTLNFFSEEMLTEHGFYHYFPAEGQKKLRGQLLDNAPILLAYVKAYETLENEKYLKIAINLADYSLDTLYDWNSGGFFERNSPDTELYTPGENILLKKPAEENSIMAYALLRLYVLTKEDAYLNAAIKTLGTHSSEFHVLDSGYYYVLSAKFILNNNLLKAYTENAPIYNLTEKRKQEEFWLKEVLGETTLSKSKNISPVKNVSDENTIVEKIETTNDVIPQHSLFFLMIISFISGLLSFLSPCCLPILPGYIAFTIKSSKKSIVPMTIAFLLGLITIFVTFGMTATVFGQLLKKNLELFTGVAGAGVMLFGLYIISGKGFQGLDIEIKKPTSLLSSFLFGSTMGISWTPCVGPVLMTILIISSTTGSVFKGGLLLFVYGLGLGLPLVLVSFFIGKMDKKNLFWRFARGKEFSFVFLGKSMVIHSTSLLSGILFIFMGYLMLSGKLIVFNKYFASAGIQKWIYSIEERIVITFLS